jgi:HSP20 family protein
MALMKSQPSTAGRMMDPFDRWFDGFLDRNLAWPKPSEVRFDQTWTPTMDFTDNPKEYIVMLDVPGIPKENLDVKLSDHVLTISGHRETATEKEEADYLWREREFGKFVRTMRVPMAVAEGKIEATVESGVLKVRLPKAEPKADARIVIK